MCSSIDTGIHTFVYWEHQRLPVKELENHCMPDFQLEISKIN